MKRTYMAAFAGLLSLSLFVGCGNSDSGAAAGQTASAQQQSQEPAGKGLTGDVAPTFTLKNPAGEDGAVKANGKPYVGNHTYWGMGKWGRFQGMSQNVSFTLTPEKLKKIFGGSSDEDEPKGKRNDPEAEGVDTNVESNVDDDMIEGQRSVRKKKATGKAETDDDGYMMFSMPWSLTVGYGITMRENTDVRKFNYRTMRYPYMFTQTLNFSGNLRISDGWNISFSSGYDFENHAISMTTASLQRDLHCFNMSCQVVLAPYTSYNFSFRCNASTLTDALKYDKRSGYSNAVQWY